MHWLTVNILKTRSTNVVVFQKQRNKKKGSPFAQC